MNARRAFLIALLALLVLAGCSRDTTYSFDVDVDAVAELEGATEPIPLADLRLPEDGIDAAEFGIPADAYEAVERLAAHAVLILTLTETDDPDASYTLGLYVGEEGATYAGEPVVSEEIELTLGEPTAVAFSGEISESENEDVLELIRSGDFSVGLAMDYAGTIGDASVTYEVDSFDLEASLTPADLLTF